MAIVIEEYQLFGLPPLPNIYVSIKGSYSVKKMPSAYIISFTAYFQASAGDPVITQRDMAFSIEALPVPPILYTMIYDYIKKQLDPNYGTAQQSLVFSDDD
jgi:hypothetical protein